ncbi:hypothetical protein CC78DRAFT_580305 [Lojkania enalia]|uniref:Secreted protein n=1 Tax=Lojkania enalia TaxID=147567 RepID=A0A9P4N4A6_9PLEO|nr:hypothetical protein CC78DRAFT_580305 [Didymosphaeria enalia]
MMLGLFMFLLGRFPTPRSGLRQTVRTGSNRVSLDCANKPTCSKRRCCVLSTHLVFTVRPKHQLLQLSPTEGSITPQSDITRYISALAAHCPLPAAPAPALLPGSTTSTRPFVSPRHECSQTKANCAVITSCGF